MNILNLCDTPEFLEVMRIVNIVITIIKIVVPILLIVSAMIDLVRAINDSELNKISKPIINKVIAAILIFLIPTFVKIIANITLNSVEYEQCLGDISLDKINDAYISREEELVSTAEESLNIYDYNNGVMNLIKIKDKDKRAEYKKRLADVKSKIDEINKPKKNNNMVSTGLGRDIKPQKELIEACKWVLHDEELQIRLQTCPPGPYRYQNAEEELPGGAVDISTGQAVARKNISLYEYQKGVFFGEQKIEISPDSRYAFMIIYKTVIIHNTVWRVVANNLTLGDFEQIYYNAGSCSQNYRNSLRVSIYDSGAHKEEIDDAVNQTRYLILANEDGTTTDATYHSFTGIEQQIEAAGSKGMSFVDILEKEIKSGNDDAYAYKTARVYDCRNLVDDGTIEPIEDVDSNSINNNIIYLGDSRTEAYKGLKSFLNIDDSKESIFATSGAKYDERFFSDMNAAKELIKSNKNKTYNVTVNYGVNAPTTMLGFCDYYVDFVSWLDKKNNFIIVSVNPFDESKSVYYSLDNRNEGIEKFNNYMKNTCINRIKEKSPNAKVYYCDIYGSIPLNEWVKRNYIQEDGVHYTNDGYKYIYNYTKKCIASIGG